MAILSPSATGTTASSRNEAPNAPAGSVLRSGYWFKDVSQHPHIASAFRTGITPQSRAPASLRSPFLPQHRPHLHGRSLFPAAAAAVPGRHESSPKAKWCSQPMSAAAALRGDSEPPQPRSEMTAERAVPRSSQPRGQQSGTEPSGDSDPAAPGHGTQPGGEERGRDGTGRPPTPTRTEGTRPLLGTALGAPRSPAGTRRRPGGSRRR